MSINFEAQKQEIVYIENNFYIKALVFDNKKDYLGFEYDYEKKEYCLKNERLSNKVKKIASMNENSNVSILQFDEIRDVLICKIEYSDLPVSVCYFKGNDINDIVMFDYKDLMILPGTMLYKRFITRDKKSLIIYNTINDSSTKHLVFIHGGPWDRSYFGYNQWHKWFFSKGYSVYDLNFRGSFNITREYYYNGIREFYNKSINDIIDLCKYLVFSKKIKWDDICLFCASYGGYAGLKILMDIKKPINVVAINPILNLKELYYQRFYSKKQIDFIIENVGNIHKKVVRQKIEKNSIRQIKTYGNHNVTIIYGTRDVHYNKKN